ncbi:MAG: HEAT repeat domain-containing protein [Deltaproteobacteria bacterium]|nr:HEAT repeat domain-containing protein [Deltaproteobacteria bacterium]
MRISRVVAVVAALGLVTMSVTAGAQRRRGRAGRGATGAAAAVAPTTAAVPATIRPSVEALESQSVDDVRGAIEALGVSGEAAAVPHLASRIRRGLPPELLDAALDAITALARPTASEVLGQLLRHRRPDVRRRAVAAIIACRGDQAGALLARALDDSDATVRSSAAVGIAELRARGAMDALFLALERGVSEATVAIGRVGNEGEIERVLGYVGRVPLDVLTPGLHEALIRTDLSERSRLAVVQRMAELASPGVRQFFQTVVPALPPSAGAIRRAIEEASARIQQ